jgi:hypothetical protein
VGNIDVYVMKCPLQGSVCAGAYFNDSISYLPNETHYIASTAGLEKDYLIIPRSDNSKVSYIVGVDSNSLYAEYTISMSLENSILMLSPGSPVTDQVETGKYDYFSVYMADTPQALTIHLTPMSGDADIYIATDAIRPNRSHYTWSSANFGEDIVVIDPEVDSRACRGCSYYISVYGFRTASYRYT